MESPGCTVQSAAPSSSAKSASSDNHTSRATSGSLPVLSRVTVALDEHPMGVAGTSTGSAVTTGAVAAPSR